jgi:hypothetical protein
MKKQEKPEIKDLDLAKFFDIVKKYGLEKATEMYSKGELKIRKIVT